MPDMPSNSGLTIIPVFTRLAGHKFFATHKISVHIQKEEQQHGEGIFNYLNSKGMYNMQ